MGYDWSKPWLIMNPSVVDRIEDFGLWEEVKKLVNVYVTSRMPLKDEIWLIPSDEIHRLKNISLNGLKTQIQSLRKKATEEK